ncbi:MAG TPA: glutathione S-transferase family protein [Caulobacteraceae bacterium]
MMRLYGAKGFGSVIVEAALTLLDEPYENIDLPADSPAAFLEAARAVNPMLQVPALLLPSGELVTESAAILIWLADKHGKLAPGVDDPARAQFLRWMVYVPAAIYSLYWIRDEPSRLAADKDAEGVLLERTAARIAECWKIMDEQVSPGRYLLGDELTVLDLYVAVVSRWTPRRRRFYQVAPKMAEVVRRVDADPRLAALWAERFPFEEGWEG